MSDQNNVIIRARNKRPKNDNDNNNNNNNNNNNGMDLIIVDPIENQLIVAEEDVTNTIVATEEKLKKVKEELNLIPTNLDKIEKQADYLNLVPYAENLTEEDSKQLMYFAGAVIKKYVDDHVGGRLLAAQNALEVVNENIIFYGEQMSIIRRDTGMIVETNNEIKTNTESANNKLAELMSNDNNMMTILKKMQESIDELSSSEETVLMVLDENNNEVALKNQLAVLQQSATTYFNEIQQQHSKQLATTKQKYNGMVRNIENKNEQLKLEMKKEKEKTTKEKERITKEKASLELELKQTKQKLLALVERAEMEKGTEKIQNNNNELALRGKTEEIAALQNNIDTLNKTIDIHNTRISEKEQQIVELTRKLEEKEHSSQLSELFNEKRIRELEQEKKNIEEEKNKLQQIVNVNAKEGDNNTLLLLEYDKTIKQQTHDKKELTEKLDEKEKEYQNMNKKNELNKLIEKETREKMDTLKKNISYYKLSNDNKYIPDTNGVTKDNDSLIHIRKPEELISKYNDMAKLLDIINSSVKELTITNGEFALKPSKLDIKITGIVHPTTNVEELLAAYKKLSLQLQNPVVVGGGGSSSSGKGGNNTISIYNPPWTLLGTSVKSTAFIRKETTLKGFADSMESKGSYELSISFFDEVDGQLVIQQTLTNKSTHFVPSSNNNNNNNGHQFIRHGVFYADFKENDNLRVTYNTLLPKMVWKEGYLQYSIKIGNDYLLVPTKPVAYNIDMTNITENLALEVKVTERLSLSVIAVPPLLALLEIVMFDY
jgi:hypothetical protein